MVFRSLLVLLILLCFTVISVNSVETSSYEKLVQIQTSYKFSNLLSDSMAFWWRPDDVENRLHVALATSHQGYVAFGFNNQTAGMTPGFAVIGINSQPPSIRVYNMTTDDDGNRHVNPLQDQTNIINSTLTQLENILFLEFTWLLKGGPCTFPLQPSSAITFLWSANDDPILNYHGGINRYYSPLNLLQGNDSTPIKSITNDCPYGLLTPLFTSCTCYGAWLPPNCHKTTHNNSVTLSSGQLSTTVYWTMNGSMVSFDVVSTNAPGWIAIGFSNSARGNMVGSDVIVADNLTNSVTSYSIKAITQFDTNEAVKLIGPSSMWILRNSVGFSFTRELKDGMNNLGTGTSVYLISASSHNPFQLNKRHDANTARATIVDLATGKSVLAAFEWNLQATHGLLMYIAWVLLIPSGYLWARYAKTLPDSLWFEGHRLIMTLGFLVTLCGFTVATIMVTGAHFDHWHMQVGLAVVCGMLFQVCSGILRPHMDPARKSIARLFFEFSHHLIGRLSILAAWITIFGGFLLMNKDYSIPLVWMYIHGGIVAVWIILHVLLEIRLRTKSHREQQYEKINHGKK